MAKPFDWRTHWVGARPFQDALSIPRLTSDHGRAVGLAVFAGALLRRTLEPVTEGSLPIFIGKFGNRERCRTLFLGYRAAYNTSNTSRNDAWKPEFYWRRGEWPQAVLEYNDDYPEKLRNRGCATCGWNITGARRRHRDEKWERYRYLNGCAAKRHLEGPEQAS